MLPSMVLEYTAGREEQMRNASNWFQDQVNAASVGVEERAKARDARIAAQPEKQEVECMDCGGPSFGVPQCWACYRAGL